MLANCWCSVNIVNGVGRDEHNQAWQCICTVASVFAMASALCFLRAHYFNATNAGWGDPEQDRHQWMLGWGIRVSAVVAPSCIAFVASRSKRALISILTGTAISGVATMLMLTRWSIGVILGLPGWFAALFTFGVHSGGGYEVTAYLSIIDALVYSGIVFLLLRLRFSV